MNSALYEDWCESLIDAVSTGAKWGQHCALYRSLRELLAKPIYDRTANPNAEQTPGTRVTERDSGSSRG